MEPGSAGKESSNIKNTLPKDYVPKEKVDHPKNDSRSSDKSKKRQAKAKAAKPRQAQTGGGGRKAPPRRKAPKIKMKYLIGFGLLALFLLGGITGLVVYLVTKDSSSGDCKSENITPVMLSSCLGKYCPFDVSRCPLPCPMGYETKDDDTCAHSCNCASHGLYQGDLIFSASAIPDLLGVYGYVDKEDTDFSLFVGSAVKQAGNRLWSLRATQDGRVAIPYKLDPVIAKNDKAQKAFTEVTKWFKQSTCIDLEPYDSSKHPKENVVQVKYKDSCASVVGFLPADESNKQTISLSDQCYHARAVAHEVMHTLGFNHEHCRPDRDLYIKIVEENILPGMESNFRKLREDLLYDLNSPYDKSSILQYGGLAFARDSGPTVIDLKTGKAIVAQQETLSAKDIEEVNQLLCKKQEPKVSPGSNRRPFGTTSNPILSPTNLPPKTTRKWPYSTTNSPNSTRLKITSPLLPTPARKGPPGSENLGPWQPWIGCSGTCGSQGNKIRVRYCLDRTKSCSSKRLDKSTCDRRPCPKTVKWSAWTAYGECTVTCGTGMMLRYRTCPELNLCGKENMQAQTCAKKKCDGSGYAVKIAWTAWGSWGPCSASCVSGVRYRYRACKKGESLSFSCPGTSNMLDYCNQFECSEAQNAPPSPMFSLESKAVAHLCMTATTEVFWVFGDFNGDGNIDLMCGSQFGEFEIGLGTTSGNVKGASWKGRLQGCGGHSSGQIRVGDFNGDGQSDIVCTDRIKRKTTVRLSNNGRFEDDGFVGSFCTGDADFLIVLDLNGDEKSDLLCRHSTDYEVLLNRFMS